MASLADADHLKLSASESQLPIAQAHRSLLALRLQAGGLIGGRLGPPLCVLFDGWDASGTGGCIRPLVSPLDPRHVRVTYRADYKEGAEGMLAQTDHSAARWHVVAGESKAYALVKVLEIVLAALEDALRFVGQEPVQTEAAL